MIECSELPEKDTAKDKSRVFSVFGRLLHSSTIMGTFVSVDVKRNSIRLLMTETESENLLCTWGKKGNYFSTINYLKYSYTHSPKLNTRKERPAFRRQVR